MRRHIEERKKLEKQLRFYGIKEYEEDYSHMMTPEEMADWEPNPIIHNNTKLAEMILDIHNADSKTWLEWRKTGKKNWNLADGVWMTESEDGMMWYLWMSDPCQTDPYWKSIPRCGLDHMSKCQVSIILKNEPWVYI